MGDEETPSLPYVLYADWCPGGKVAWVTASGSQTLTAPAVLNLGQTSQLTYSYWPCPLQQLVHLPMRRA